MLIQALQNKPIQNKVKLIAITSSTNEMRVRILLSHVKSQRWNHTQ